ncbi:hypothetical protein KAT92_01765 [Candidatus Babeliales bacterium]|nr:hypothetical protein [Candidatus Babeliales bacterium]
MKKLLALALCLSVGGLADGPQLHSLPFRKKKDPDRVETVKKAVLSKTDAMAALSAAMLVVKKSIATTLPKGDMRTGALASLGGIKKGFIVSWKEAKKGADAATVERISGDEFSRKLSVLTELVNKINAKAGQLDGAREQFERAVKAAVGTLIQVIAQK